ncbi:MAG: Sir2 family NAD-dependent protein deacetylase [Nitrospinaceae bacterium]
MLDKSAKLLREAKRILFLTSAGMSADSNIPTFRDKDGYWKNFPPFKEKNLEAQDLASPWAFRNVLPHAWAFYEWRRQNAYENEPHEGYHIINRWLADRDGFIHTTNTDGYHLRSGCPPDRVMEVHGSMWRLQCLEGCSRSFWENDSVPLCKLDRETMKASGYPSCPGCRGIARPHILMFGDWEYVGHPDQEENFDRFVQQPVDLAVLIGSSGAVPTNDYIALRLKDQGAEVININPDPSTNSIVNTDLFLPMKSKEALVALDKMAFGG